MLCISTDIARLCDELKRVSSSALLLSIADNRSDMVESTESAAAEYSLQKVHNGFNSYGVGDAVSSAAEDGLAETEGETDGDAETAGDEVGSAEADEDGDDTVFV